MNWRTRIDPPAHLRWLYRDAKHRWEHVDHPQAPARVGWLDRDHTRDLRELDRYLGRRLFPTGLALAHHPATEIELLETLLKHSPVVFWPWSTTGFPDAARGDLKNIWDELPHALMAAYRDRWNGPDVEPVADLRAVWEDPDWLEFIRKLNPQLNSSTG